MTRTKKIAGIGCLTVLLLIAGAAALFWFNRPQMPIVVDAPGAGGERITLNGRPANFFPAEGAGPHPAIIMLGGSEGGLQEPHNVMARKLAAQGFSVLYPGYYRTSESNQSFNMVPLETFDRAIEWLSARDDIDSNRIGIIGGSKGAEGALLVAVRHPEIKAVVAVAPTNAVWQGFDWNSMDMSQFSSSWTEYGKPLPYLPYKPIDWRQWFRGGAMLEMYRQSWEALPEHPEAEIPVERIAAPVLLICGEGDALWPSCDMARAIDRRAEEKGGPEVTLLAYEDAGHMLYGAVRSPGEDRYDSLSALGGTPEGNNAARKDNWPRIVAFLKSSLGGVPRE